MATSPQISNECPLQLAIDALHDSQLSHDELRTVVKYLLATEKKANPLTDEVRENFVNLRELINPRTGKVGLDEGSLYVGNITNLPGGDMLYYPVESPAKAKVLIEQMAEEQLKDERIVSNAFFLMEWGIENVDPEVEGWTDWYSEEGEDIDEYLEFPEDATT